MRPGQAGAVLPGDRAGDAAAGGPGGAAAGPAEAQLAKLDLLVLDELGYVPASKVGAELLFDVISTAYERTSVIVTTNLPFEQWTGGAGQRAADRGGAGPADAPLPHPGDGGGELPAAGRHGGAAEPPARPDGPEGNRQ